VPDRAYRRKIAQAGAEATGHGGQRGGTQGRAEATPEGRYKLQKGDGGLGRDGTRGVARCSRPAEAALGAPVVDGKVAFIFPRASVYGPTMRTQTVVAAASTAAAKAPATAGRRTRVRTRAAAAATSPAMTVVARSSLGGLTAAKGLF